MIPTQDIVSRTTTLILAGGRGERLSPMTRHRSKPAVPFGNGRIIDFALQNCLQSNLIHPLVITQYQAAHLSRHVRRWWRERSASLNTTAAPVCVPAPLEEYRGTADALHKNLSALPAQTEHVLVLSADHIYETDYRKLLEFHVRQNADATLSAIVYPSEMSKQFGILQVNTENRVCGFEEKPSQPIEIPGRPGRVLANMGVYVFRKDVLLEELRRDVADIGRNVLPRLVAQKNVYSFPFEGYWRDVGTLDSYYDATREWHAPSESGNVIADGVRIHHAARVTESILLPGVSVGAHARIHRAIIDEDVHVLAGATVGLGDDEALMTSANGIVVVPSEMIVAPAKHRRFARPYDLGPASIDPLMSL